MSRVTHLLVHRATINRIVRVQAGPGRWTESPSPIGTGVACRVHGVSGRDLLYAQQLQVKASHVGYFEPDQSLVVQDDVVPTTAPGFVGKTFRVTAIVPPSIDHHLKALLEETQTGG